MGCHVLTSIGFITVKASSRSECAYKTSKLVSLVGGFRLTTKPFRLASSYIRFGWFYVWNLNGWYVRVCLTAISAGLYKIEILSKSSIRKYALAAPSGALKMYLVCRNSYTYLEFGGGPLYSELGTEKRRNSEFRDTPVCCGTMSVRTVYPHPVVYASKLLTGRKKVKNGSSNGQTGPKLSKMATITLNIACLGFSF